MSKKYKEFSMKAILVLCLPDNKLEVTYLQVASYCCVSLKKLQKPKPNNNNKNPWSNCIFYNSSAYIIKG